MNGRPSCNLSVRVATSAFANCAAAGKDVGKGFKKVFDPKGN